MIEQEGEISSNLDDFIGELRKQADVFRAASEYCDRQIEFLNSQRENLGRYGAQFPIAMTSTNFIIERVVASASLDAGESDLVPPPGEPRRIGTGAVRLRPRARRVGSPPPHPTESRNKKYNIPPQVKPIMNAIFGSGQEDLPQDLDSLFDRMYGNDWHLRTITVPLRPGVNNPTTIGEDLSSADSYVRRLIRGADEVICKNMRGNADPIFGFRGKIAAADLRQLYNKIEGVGWDVYDDFMIRIGIRPPQSS